MKITKKRYFFKNRWNAYFYNDFSAYGKTTAAPKRSFGLSRPLPGPPWVGTLFLGTPQSVPGANHFLPGPPLGSPKTNPGAPKAAPIHPKRAQERPRATSNPQSEHA